MVTTRKTLILLTATVAPMMDIVRFNPELRLKDYLSALALWWREFKSLPVDILFCENSNYDLKPIREWIEQNNAGSRIQVLQFKGNKNLVAILGKGAGEAEIYDICFQYNFISGYDYVLKSTGRLFVRNAKNLLSQMISEGSDWAISFRGSMDFVDSRFFIIRLELYQKYLLGLGKEVDDKQGAYIEQAMLKRVLNAITDGHIWGQFKNLPRYEGVGGTDGKKHGSQLGNLRYFIKNGLHIFGIKFGTYWYL